MVQYVDNKISVLISQIISLSPDSDYDALAGLSITDPSTDTPAAAVSAPKEEPVYASGYYLTPKVRA